MTTLSIVKNKTTYEEVLLQHLEDLPEELRKSSVSSLLVIGDGAEGPFYSVAKKIGVLECLGLLEVLKSYLVEECMSDYDY